MKLQKTSVILIILALGLGCVVYFYEVQGGAQREAGAKSRQIFSFEEAQVQSLTIEKQEQTLKFERVTQNAGEVASRFKWQMKAPLDAPASDPAVSFLLNLLVEAKSANTLRVPSTQLQEYGLDKPLATVEVKLNNQQTHQLILGKPDFTRSLLYARADPPRLATEQLEVLLVPINFEYAVQRPLSEWQGLSDKKI